MASRNRTLANVGYCSELLQLLDGEPMLVSRKGRRRHLLPFTAPINCFSCVDLDNRHALTRAKVTAKPCVTFIKSPGDADFNAVGSPLPAVHGRA
jgi:hypothetical protein